VANSDQSNDQRTNVDNDDGRDRNNEEGNEQNVRIHPTRKKLVGMISLSFHQEQVHQDRQKDS